jgi:hypothetical protein
MEADKLCPGADGDYMTQRREVFLAVGARESRRGERTVALTRSSHKVG